MYTIITLLLTAICVRILYSVVRSEYLRKPGAVVFLACMLPHTSFAYDCDYAMKSESIGDVSALTQSAEFGDHCAEYSLARLFFLGQGAVAKDWDKSNAYLVSAAKGGLDVAQNELAHRYMGMGGFETDYSQVVYWLEKASAQGHVPSLTLLGRILVEGRFVDRDIQSGMRYLLSADDKGGAVAHQILESMADSMLSTKVDKRNSN